MLPQPLAKAFAFKPARRLLHAALLCLVAAHEVGDTEMKESRKVRCQVARTEAQVGVVKFVAAEGVNPPCVRVARHDDEARTSTTGVVQAAKATQERVARSRELWIRKPVTDSGEGAHVEVATDEVDGLQDHVLTKALQERERERERERGRCVTFLGDFDVNMD